MLHISDNIKIIRKLWGKTQKEFAEYFTGISEINQKSYELNRANPGVLYIIELSKMTGVSEEDLRDRRLDLNEIPRVAPSVEEVKNVKRGTFDIVYDSKEGVLQLLKIALDENAIHAAANDKHASANEKNAAASDKNATAIMELVRLLGIKLSSNQKSPTPQGAQKKDDKRRGPVERTRKFADKQGIHSLPKNKKQKGIST